MIISNAERFIREISKNNDFRRSFYQWESPDEIKKSITDAGYSFKYHEFEDSINNLKTRCASEEDAIMLDELLLWWQMLLPFEDSEGCSTDCSPSDCALCSLCN